MNFGGRSSKCQRHTNGTLTTLIDPDDCAVLRELIHVRVMRPSPSSTRRNFPPHRFMETNADGTLSNGPQKAKGKQ